MWFRYFAISLLKWIFLIFFQLLLMSFILPSTISSTALAWVIWITVICFAFAFACWAFAKQVPGWKDVLKLIGVWLVVSLILQNAFEMFFMGRMLFVLRSPELFFSFELEIVAIILAAVAVRRYKKTKKLAEGIAA